MGHSWIGTRWRAATLLRLPGGDVAPGEEFTFTEALERAGYVPDMWLRAGNAELVPTRQVSAPPKEPAKPVGSAGPAAAGDAAKAAPAGQRELVKPEVPSGDARA